MRVDHFRSFRPSDTGNHRDPVGEAQHRRRPHRGGLPGADGRPVRFRTVGHASPTERPFVPGELNHGGPPPPDGGPVAGPGSLAGGHTPDPDGRPVSFQSVGQAEPTERLLLPEILNRGGPPTPGGKPTPAIDSPAGGHTPGPNPPPGPALVRAALLAYGRPDIERS
jgi:hypothetical protein